MRDDRTLLQWLLHVEQGGICVIYDAPREQGTTVKICDRVGFAKQNYYGCVSRIVYVRCALKSRIGT